MNLMKDVIKGAVIASAVGSLFAACATSGGAAETKPDKVGSVVHCNGANSCKGQGSCSGANSSCKSQNACKGQGWIETNTEKDCTDKGGTVAAK